MQEKSPDKERLEAFTFRRKMRIPWVGGAIWAKSSRDTRNENVSICKRQLEFLGHMMRKEW